MKRLGGTKRGQVRIKVKHLEDISLSLLSMHPHSILTLKHFVIIT